MVGAHWDTVPNSPGFNDNGSGMAAMLEIARALKHAECKNKYTYIFVALDMEETGTQGATAFVQDFLIKLILKPMDFPEFQVKKNLAPRHFDDGHVSRHTISHPY